MADFGTAVRNLRPGYIAKTTRMRGYLRRHELGSRSANPDYVSGGSAPEYLFYRYEDGRRVQKTGSAASPISTALEVPGTSDVADVAFDLEFVENAAWDNSDSDSKRVYVFRCWQRGGTETSPGDSRLWHVTTVTGTGEDGSDDELPDSPFPDYSVTYSDLKLDSATFEILVSQDWEYNVQTEADYVASTGSTARW